jgi:hypothetical protein
MGKKQSQEWPSSERALMPTIAVPAYVAVLAAHAARQRQLIAQRTRRLDRDRRLWDRVQGVMA